MFVRRNVVTLLAATLFVAVAVPAGAQAPAGRTKVVATFSILGDFVRNVGGDRVDLSILVGPDGDAHVYSPTPADGRRLAEANVVFTNGLRFEGWINRLIRSSGTKAAVIEASKGVRPLREEAGHSHGHQHDGGVDPHAWQSIANAKIYVTNIRDALGAADPAGKATYDANAAAYLDRLDALEREVEAAIAAIPRERRRIITSHDAFGYFEQSYGLDFVAPQGVSTEAEASARDVARIIEQIRKEKIGAVFFETISDPRLVERIAAETGARIGGKVYSDALSQPDGPAGTYIDMMRHNIRAFAAALTR